MKKNIIILTVCACSLMACTKNTLVSDAPKDTIGAFIDNGTKVYIDDPVTEAGVTTYPIKWAANDAIALIHLNADVSTDPSVPDAYKIYPGYYRAFQFLMADGTYAGQKYAAFTVPTGAANFTGFDSGEKYLAVFPPAPAANVRSDLSVKPYGTGSVRAAVPTGLVSYTIPQIQEYDPSGKYGIRYSDYHMFASVNGSNKNNIHFTPGQAVVVLTLQNSSTSTKQIKSIVVTSNLSLNQYSNNGFVGTMSFQLTEGEITSSIPEQGNSGRTYYTLVLNCNNAEISTSSSKDFGFMFREGAQMGNLTFTITFSDDSTMVVTKNTCPSLSAGTVYKAKAYIRDTQSINSNVSVAVLTGNEISF